MEFTEKFKTFSNTDLFRIVDNSIDYQQDAVETAKAILAERNLSEEEIQFSKKELELEREQKIAKEAKRKAIEDNIKTLGKSIIDVANPIRNEPPTTTKTINIISLIFGAMFLFKLIQEFEMILDLVINSFSNWGYYGIIYIGELIFIPTAIFLFYKRKKYGWFLFVIFLSYSAISFFGWFLFTLTMDRGVFFEMATFIEMTSPTTYLVTFLFYVGIIWVIQKENVRTIYGISKKNGAMTISITALITILILTYLFVFS